MGTDRMRLKRTGLALTAIVIVALSLPAAPAAQVVQLYSNGPLATVPGGGAGGMDATRLQNTLGMSTLGFNAGFFSSNTHAVADDFTVPWPGWNITRVTVFGYQADSGFVSSLSDLRLLIMNGPPNAPGSQVIYGSPLVNVLAHTSFTNVLRDSQTTPGISGLPIMSAVANVNLSLPAGTYWLVWAMGGNLPGGPFVAPITIPGQKVTGNGLQHCYCSGGWAPALDTGSQARQGFPFVLEGIGATPPTLTVSANPASLRAGDRLTLAASVTAGTGLADAYILIDLPVGGTLSLTPGGFVSGTVPYARGFRPYAFSGTLLDITLPSVPLGTYGVRAVLTAAGTSTQLSLPSQASFKVLP